MRLLTKLLADKMISSDIQPAMTERVFFFAEKVLSIFVSLCHEGHIFLSKSAILGMATWVLSSISLLAETPYWGTSIDRINGNVPIARAAI